VFDGQSLLNSPTTGLAPPYVVMSGVQVPFHIAAISGTTFAQRSPSVSERVDAKIKSVGKGSVYVNLGGYSDIVGGMTGAAAAASAISNAQARKAAGFTKAIECTQPDNTQMTTAQHTERLAYNAAVLASNAFDYVIDLASVPGLVATDASLFSDGLHFTQAGANLVASAMQSTVLAALAAVA
jgi:hypothetical protein